MGSLQLSIQPLRLRLRDATLVARDGHRTLRLRLRSVTLAEGGSGRLRRLGAGCLDLRRGLALRRLDLRRGLALRRCYLTQRALRTRSLGGARTIRGA